MDKVCWNQVISSLKACEQPNSNFRNLFITYLRDRNIRKLDGQDLDQVSLGRLMKEANYINRVQDVEVNHE